MKKLALPIVGTLLMTSTTLSFSGNVANANSTSDSSNEKNVQVEKNISYKDIPRPDTKYWNKQIESNGDEVYTASDNVVYQELKDKGKIKEDPKLETMLQNRASGGINKYVVHKNGTVTIYLTNKWASCIAAGEVGLVASLIGGGPVAALLSPLIAGALGDVIPKNGVKIDAFIAGSPYIKSVKPQ